MLEKGGGRGGEKKSTKINPSPPKNPEVKFFVNATSISTVFEPLIKINFKSLGIIKINNIYKQ
jgi:hypothetical protein